MGGGVSLSIYSDSSARMIGDEEGLDDTSSVISSESMITRVDESQNSLGRFIAVRCFSRNYLIMPENYCDPDSNILNKICDICNSGKSSSSDDRKNGSIKSCKAIANEEEKARNQAEIREKFLKSVHSLTKSPTSVMSV